MHRLSEPYILGVLDELCVNDFGDGPNSLDGREVLTLHILSGSELPPGVFGVEKVPLKDGVGQTRDGLPAVQDGALDVEVVGANRCIVQQLRIADFAIARSNSVQAPLGTDVVPGYVVLQITTGAWLVPPHLMRGDESHAGRHPPMPW
jgi:hypothetical protein